MPGDASNKVAMSWLFEYLTEDTALAWVHNANRTYLVISELATGRSRATGQHQGFVYALYS